MGVVLNHCFFLELMMLCVIVTGRGLWPFDWCPDGE